MKILLINPPLQRLSEVKNSYFPLGLGYLAAFLEDHNHYVRIYNADKGEEEKSFYPITSNWERIKRHENYVKGLNDDQHLVWTEIREIFRQSQADLVGITTMTTTLPSSFKVASLCKEYSRHCQVVMGGIHPTVEPHRIMQNPNVDFVVKGEGEETLLELVQTLSSNSLALGEINGLGYRRKGILTMNPPRKMMPDINLLPFPGRHLVLRPDLYSDEMGAIVTSRGCPFKCTFCEAHNIWTRKVRYSTVDNVLAEMKEVINTYHVKGFRFDDDSFTIDRRRILELCQKIIDEKLEISWSCLSRVDLVDDELLAAMKKAGCFKINFGIESGSDRIRQMINKGISNSHIYEALRLVRKNHIKFGCCFLIGLPYETEEDVWQSIQMIKKIRPDFTNICTFTPYPGSPIYEDCLDQGLIKDDMDWGLYSHHSPYNRFIRDIPEEIFQKVLNLMIKAADSCNSKLNFSYLMERLRNRWRAILKNPFRYIGGMVRLLCQSLHGKIKLHKARSLYYGKKD